MTTYAEAQDRTVVHTIIVMGSVIPVLLIGYMWWTGLETPLVPVPGVRQAKTVEPNAISDQYLKAFARSWLTRRHSVNAYSYEPVALTVSEDCTLEYRLAFLKSAEREFQRYKALEKTSSAQVDNLVVETEGVGIWKVHYRLVQDSFYASIAVGQSVRTGSLYIIISTLQSGQRPVQIAGDYLDPDLKQTINTHVDAKQ